jgi:hypothetical protein
MDSLVYTADDAADARKACVELVLGYARICNMNGADMDELEIELGTRIDHAMCVALDIGKHIPKEET